MHKPGVKTDLTCGGLATAGLAVLLAVPSGAVWQPVLAAVAAYALLAAILARHLRGRRFLGWANRVTLLRAVITCVLAGALLRPGLYIEQAGPIVGLVLLALALDGLDGWLARRLDESGAFGARFDMEIDAALILVLCAGLWLSGRAPMWVLAIGLMRPAFLTTGLALPLLAKPLPESFRRKLVCVVQVAVLPAALLPILPGGLRLSLLAAALGALTLSFAIDIAWLIRQRRASHHPQWRTP